MERMGGNEDKANTNGKNKNLTSHFMNGNYPVGYETMYCVERAIESKTFGGAPL
jgi:hypothetical protein